MTNHKRITKPGLWKQIHDMEQKLCFMERFLEEKGLLAEAKEYVENAIQDLEELPFN